MGDSFELDNMKMCICVECIMCMKVIKKNEGKQQKMKEQKENDSELRSGLGRRVTRGIEPTHHHGADIGCPLVQS